MESPACTPLFPPEGRPLRLISPHAKRAPFFLLLPPFPNKEGIFH